MSLKRKLDLTRLFLIDYKSSRDHYLKIHIHFICMDDISITDVNHYIDEHHKNFVWDDNQVGSNLMDIINPLDIQNV